MRHTGDRHPGRPALPFHWLCFPLPPYRPQAATKTANSNLASKNTEIAGLKKQLTAAKSATTTNKAAARPAVATATDACGTLQNQLDAKTAELTLALQKLANLNKLLATTEGLLKSTQSSLDIANDKLIAAQSAEGAPSVPCLLLSMGTLPEQTARAVRAGSALCQAACGAVSLPRQPRTTLNKPPPTSWHQAATGRLPPCCPPTPAPTLPLRPAHRRLQGRPVQRAG